jgi:hypothetical protein
MILRVVTLALTLTWPLASQAAPCSDTFTSSNLSLALDAAEARFAARDKDGVLKSAEEAQTIVPCLREELTPGAAARLHRVQGLRAFLDKDPEATRIWFAASRQIQPEYQLPTTLVPSGHPLHQVYSTAAAPVDVERLTLPAEGRMRFDGRTTVERPLKRPTVFQYVNGVGQVQISQLVDVGDTVQQEGILFSKGPTKNTSRGRGLKVGLLAGSGAALVTSVVLYAAGVSAKAEYQDTKVVPGNRAKLEDLYRSNRTLSTASGVCAATALTLGTAALFVGHW